MARPVGTSQTRSVWLRFRRGVVRSCLLASEAGPRLTQLRAGDFPRGRRWRDSCLIDGPGSPRVRRIRTSFAPIAAGLPAKGGPTPSAPTSRLAGRGAARREASRIQYVRIPARLDDPESGTAERTTLA